jgi:4-oxalocrotonate tautomerase
VLTLEQKSALIRDITGVVRGAMKEPADRSEQETLRADLRNGRRRLRRQRSGLRAAQIRRKRHMPVAKVYVPEGSLTADQRREIVKGIHDVINRVEKRPADAQTYVVITEVPSGHWGNAGSLYVPKP